MASHPLEWAELARPKPGFILFERDEEPTMVSGSILGGVEVGEGKFYIHLPSSYSQRRRMPLATVIATNGVDGWPIETGDRILVHASAGKSETFGRGDGKRIFYVCRPQQVVAVVVEAEAVEERGEHPLGRYAYRATAAEQASEGRADHGVVAPTARE